MKRDCSTCKWLWKTGSSDGAEFGACEYLVPDDTKVPASQDLWPSRGGIKIDNGRCRLIFDGYEIDFISCNTWEPLEQDTRDRLITTTSSVLKILQDLLYAPYGLWMLPRLSEHACEALIRDTWVPRIEAVIDEVKGLEGGCKGDLND